MLAEKSVSRKPLFSLRNADIYIVRSFSYRRRSDLSCKDKYPGMAIDFPSPPIRSGEVFSSVIFFLSFSSFVMCFFGCSDGMEREACVCHHGYERSDLCAEIIIIIIIITVY